MGFKLLSTGDHDLEVTINPFALRKAKIVYNFGLSKCNRVNTGLTVFTYL